MASTPRLSPLAALLILGACGGGNDTMGVTPPPPPPTSTQFVIQGGSMSGFNENVHVTLDGAAATGLTVTVNGTPLADQGFGTYFGQLPTALTAGSAVQIRVSNGTLTGTGNAVVPAQPVITNVDKTTMGQPVTISWTSATSPDSFTVSLNYHMPDNSAVAVLGRVAGNVRQVTLQSSEILAGGVVFSVGIDGFNVGSFSGDAAATSNMHLRTSSASYPLTIP